MAVTEILMPQMVESVMEGTVIKWLVKPGDVVELGIEGLGSSKQTAKAYK